MNNPKPTALSPLVQQRGAAVLVIVLILLLGMMMITLTSSRTGMVEQKITGNDYRSREVQEAANAGLDYAVSWAGRRSITANMACPGDVGCPALDTITGSTSKETYSISQLTFTKGSNFIKVDVTVQGTDTNISASAEAFIQATSILTTDGSMPPPMAIAGCLTSTSGTPDIYPNWNDIDGDNTKDPNEWADTNGNRVVDLGEWTDTNGNGSVDNEVGRVLVTSQPEMVGGNFCLDYCGNGGGCDAAAVGTGHPHLDLHGGMLQNNQQFPNNSIWNYYFNVSQATFQGSASDTLSTNPGLYWITSTGNWGGGTYGTITDPVIIVFANGCPKPTGNTTIYGILFFAAPNACVNDPMNGWGNVTVYGSVGANGGINKMNANLAIHGVGDDAGTPQNLNSPPLDATRIPGTWKDF